MTKKKKDIMNIFEALLTFLIETIPKKLKNLAGKIKTLPATARILLRIAIVITLVFVLSSLPWTIIYVGGMLSEDPPQPEITYGEFPFELVYEINGERVTIEDTLVIEYEGIEWNEGLGKYNAWNVSYESQRETGKEEPGKDYNRLILFSGFIEGNGSATIRFELGSCEYYMGLEERDLYYKRFGVQPGDIIISSPKYDGPISNEELYEKYNIKIIKKSISQPIGE